MQSLYIRAAFMLAQLRVASETATKEGTLVHARIVRDELNAGVAHLEAAVAFWIGARVSQPHPVKLGRLGPTIGQFQGALSRKGSAVLQQKYATSMLEALKQFRLSLRKATRSDWRSLFSEFDPLIQRVEKGISASLESRRRAVGLAVRLREASRLDPVEKLAQIEQHLGVTGVRGCMDEIVSIGEQLEAALATIDRETQVMTEEVKKILQRAATEEGFPLTEVTSETLDHLREAGVLDTLFIHRS